MIWVLWTHIVMEVRGYSMLSPTNRAVKVPRKKLHQIVGSIHPYRELREGIVNLLPRVWRIFTPTSSDTPERTVAQLLFRPDVRSEPAPLVVSLTPFTGEEDGTHHT
jgi:hypothetical protein